MEEAWEDFQEVFPAAFNLFTPSKKQQTAMILILLDIDGTLVDSLQLEEKYYPQAVCECLGLQRIKTN